jgi:flagellar biosynthetic protein FliQ
MTESDALDLIRNAIWAACVISAPSVIAVTVVGIVIAFFQALTQIQEMTLTFVPKILVVFAVLYVSGPFMGAKVASLTASIYEKAEKGYR